MKTTRTVRVMTSRTAVTDATMRSMAICVAAVVTQGMLWLVLLPHSEAVAQAVQIQKGPVRTVPPPPDKTIVSDEKPAAEPVDAAQPLDPQKVARQQQLQLQRKQNREHMEGVLQSMLQSQLEVIRQTCGSLSVEQRSRIMAAGKSGVTQAAEGYAKRQTPDQGHNGNQNAEQPIDPRDIVHRALASALRFEASAEEMAAYLREEEFRLSRRTRAATQRIVAILDAELLLTRQQREEITVDLRQKWDPTWIQVIRYQPGNYNGYTVIAPDCAEVCISPHLTTQQAADWKIWRERAPSTMFNNATFDYNPQPGADQRAAWWGK